MSSIRPGGGIIVTIGTNPPRALRIGGIAYEGIAERGKLRIEADDRMSKEEEEEVGVSTPCSLPRVQSSPGLTEVRKRVAAVGILLVYGTSYFEV